MIKNQDDLKHYLISEKNNINNLKDKSGYRYMWFVNHEEYMIYKYLYYLRKQEYYINTNNGSKVNSLLSLVYERKKHKLGNKLGFYIGPNCFDEGLTIFHHSSIVVNPDAKVGKNCKLHGNNCIGNNGKDNLCPIIGNNVDIGFGAVIIGNVTIADGVKIGANAVVTKSFNEPNITIAGIPAKRIK